MPVIDEGPRGPAWVLPDEPVPVRLMNTIWADRDGVHDALLGPADLGSWLVATGLSAGSVTVDDVAAFRGLRTALRRLAALLTEDTRQAAVSLSDPLDAAVDEVNRAATAGPGAPRLRLLANGLERDDRPAGPAAALAAVAGEAIDVLSGQTGQLLRACPAPRCVLYFVKDHPRRAWCSVACGNRARAARHYERHRPPPRRAAPEAGGLP